MFRFFKRLLGPSTRSLTFCMGGRVFLLTVPASLPEGDVHRLKNELSTNLPWRAVILPKGASIQPL